MEIGNAMATGFFKAACGKSWPLFSNLVAPAVADLQRVLDAIGMEVLTSHVPLLYFEFGYAGLQLGVLSFDLEG